MSDKVWQKGTFSTICSPMGLVKLEVRVKVICPMMVDSRNMRIPSASFPGRGKGPLICELLESLVLGIELVYVVLE